MIFLNENDYLTNKRCDFVYIYDFNLHNSFKNLSFFNIDSFY